MFDTPPAIGVIITIKRETPFDEPWITWRDGTVLIADDLNAQLTQVLFVLQENQSALLGALAYDPLLDAYNALEHRISNLADPTKPQDAVTYKVLQQEILILKQCVLDALVEAERIAAASKKYAEEARQYAQDYIPYSFGRFRINDNAELVVEYYGDSKQDTITINDDGEVIITTGGVETP